MVENKKQFLEFLQKVGVGAKDRVASSPNSYVSYLNSVSKIIGKTVNHELLKSEDDIRRIVAQIGNKRAASTVNNYCSAMRQYIVFGREG